ncbi:MAG: 4Fe-4S dicluster-binding protein [Bryobacterales bacterium]|nr:4Fe-4S dicluster-binding protein [Bryobacterales bacterium]
MPQTNAKPDRGFVTIDANECKGCGLCVEACTPGALALAAHLNRMGYHPAEYAGQGCNGCGLCFYACPEPGAITVYRQAKTLAGSERAAA